MYPLNSIELDPLNESVTDTIEKESRMCKTVLFNDEQHTYDYVVEMLTFTCKLSRDAAFKCAVEVDLSGRTIVFTGTHEECLLASAKINQFGPDHRLPHSNQSMDSEVQN